MEPWSIRAVNLPEHADNVVHTDAGAQAAGYPRALVAGVTVNAYLTHLPTVAWGEDWLTKGSAEVRFRSPVFDDDLVECVAVDDPSGGFDHIVEARVDGDVKATLGVVRQAEPRLAQSGDPLPPMAFSFDPGLSEYGTRAGDTQTVNVELGLVHPSVWPVLGNRVTMAHLVTGPWIHVRSAVTHLGPARVGADAVAESVVVRWFDSRAGRRAVLDITVNVDGESVAMIEHESIIELAS